MRDKGVAPTSRTLTDGTIVLEGPRGVARMSRVAPGVLLYVCSGQFSSAYAQPMIAEADREIRWSKKLVIAADAEALSSVDTGFREAWTEWIKLHKHEFRMELFVRTKLMEMAAGLVNLFTGVNVVKTSASVEAWQRSVARDVPGFRRGAPAA
jgi:hypothetical protein